MVLHVELPPPSLASSCEHSFPSQLLLPAGVRGKAAEGRPSAWTSVPLWETWLQTDLLLSIVGYLGNEPANRRCLFFYLPISLYNCLSIKANN